MMFAGIQKIDAELRKVNATKLKIRELPETNAEEDDFTEAIDSLNLELGFGQKKIPMKAVHFMLNIKFL
jgi:hypothetical protein